MRRFPGHPSIFLSVILAAGASGLSEVARAEADGPDYFDVVKPDRDVRLVLRSGSDPSAPVIATIAGDSTGLQNLGCTGGMSFEEFTNATEAERQADADNRWCRVALRGREGWVLALHLRKASSPPADAEEAVEEARPVWRLVARDGFPVPDGAELAFDVSGALLGSTGCNRFETTADLVDGRLFVDPAMAMTRAACPDDATVELDVAMLALLRSQPALTIDPFADQILLRNESAVFVFQRIQE